MWEKIRFNIQNIEKETDKAILIKLPKKSNYSGWVFWHPSKLVRLEGGKGYHYSFSFTEEFNFRLIKYGKGKYNKNEIIDEVNLDCEKIKEIFRVMDDVISKNENEENESYLLIKEPQKIDDDIEIEEELKK